MSPYTKFTINVNIISGAQITPSCNMHLCPLVSLNVFRPIVTTKPEKGVVSKS